MSNRAIFDTLRSLASGSLSGSYANIGSALSVPGCAFRVTNNTDGDLIISLDGGITDHLFVGSGSFVLYDVRANHRPANQGDYMIEAGTQFSAKESTSTTTGSVYVDVMT